MMRLHALVILVAGCGGGGSSDNGLVDAPVGSGTITITLTGKAEELSIAGAVPVQGVLVEAFLNAAETTPIVSTMTNASGDYTLVVEATGALDGFVKATKAGLVTTYLYPPKPLAADFAGAALKMVSPTNFGLLSNTLCGATQDAAKGTIAVVVSDAAGMAVAGAAVASTPAASKYCYNANGVPNRNATGTDVDGVGYMFNVDGAVSVAATKAGATFVSHRLTARAGALTTTLVAP